MSTASKCRALTVALVVLFLSVLATAIVYRKHRLGWSRRHDRWGSFDHCLWGPVNTHVELFYSDDECEQSIRHKKTYSGGVLPLESRPKEDGRPKVPGVILIISCERHLADRVPKINISGSVDNWPVIVATGDPTLTEPFVHSVDPGHIIVQCEDSYIHLMKKVVLAIEAVRSMYDIQHGVLRCGDDLEFDVKRLSRELATITSLGDYVGTNGSLVPSYRVWVTNFMLNYYATHRDDFNNPKQGIEGLDLYDIELFGILPRVPFAIGVVFYISNRACDVLSEYMRKINLNVFTTVTFNGVSCFPFTFEDVGIGYVLYVNRIKLVNKLGLFSRFKLFNPIAMHTNENK